MTELLLDVPIERAEQDALGRTEFAQSVAALILSAPKATSSQVIGLYGKWGEGKTSAKNLILETYKTKLGRDHPLVEFSPWEYAEGSRLPFLFFSAVANSYGKETKEQSAKNLAVKFRDLGYLLDLAAYVPKLTPIAKLLSGLSKLTHKYLSKKVIPLPSVRADIERLLIEDTRRLVVVIDDLDRLSAENVRRMIQLVKANGDFPNITYILLCDRDYVSRALCTVVDGGTDDEGREYLEKVVNFGLDLPRIRTTDLRNYLVKLVQDVLTLHRVEQDQFDLETELPPLVLQLVHDLRDVKRLVAGFEFQLSAHRRIGGETANVHLGDLIVLEAYRLFDPKFYHAVHQCRSELMCDEVSLYTRYSGNEITLDNEWVEKHLFQQISERHIHTARKFLADHLGWLYCGHPSSKNYSRDRVDACKTTFRLKHPDCFDRYFNLYVDPSQFSNADYLGFRRSLSNKTDALTLLKHLFDKNRLRDFLSNIETGFTVDEPKQQENFVSALMLAAEFARDQLPDMHISHGDKFSYSLSTHFHRCVRFCLERTISTEARSNLLIRVFKHETTALVLPISILSTEHASRDRQAAVPQLLLDRDYAQLNELCLMRIEERQEQGKLIGHIDERDIRQMWLTIGKPERIKEMLADDFRSYPSVMHAMLPFTGYVSSTDGTFYTIFLDSLENYVDPTKALDILKLQPDLPVAEAGIRDCLSFSIEAKAKNEPYDQDAQLQAVYKRKPFGRQ